LAGDFENVQCLMSAATAEAAAGSEGTIVVIDAEEAYIVGNVASTMPTAEGREASKCIHVYYIKVEEARARALLTIQFDKHLAMSTAIQAYVWYNVLILVHGKH
jgi:hypothetical protein